MKRPAIPPAAARLMKALLALPPRPHVDMKIKQPNLNKWDASFSAAPAARPTPRSRRT